MAEIFKILYLFKTMEKITLEGSISTPLTMNFIYLYGIVLQMHFCLSIALQITTNPDASHSIPPKKMIVS